MSRPVYHTKLERMLLPSQYALLRHIQNLYPGDELSVTDDLLLKEPPVPDAVHLGEFNDKLLSIWEQFGPESGGSLRVPVCDWITTLPALPAGTDMASRMRWVKQMVNQINRQLSDLPRL